jgi:uncharacterized integral membrane protein
MVLLGKHAAMAHPSEDRPEPRYRAAEPPIASMPSDVPSASPEPAPPSADLAPPSADLAPPPAHPAPPSADLLPPAPVEHVTEPRHRPVSVPWTRTSAVWSGVWAGVAALILLIIFVAQNTSSVEINIGWMHPRIPLALGLLIAGVCGALVAMAVAAVRIIQLRRLVRRGR